MWGCGSRSGETLAPLGHTMVASIALRTLQLTMLTITEAIGCFGTGPVLVQVAGSLITTMPSGQCHLHGRYGDLDLLSLYPIKYKGTILDLGLDHPIKAGEATEVADHIVLCSPCANSRKPRHCRGFFAPSPVLYSYEETHVPLSR